MVPLGVGTGRVALPLADAGVEVHGIDTSELDLTARLAGFRLRERWGDWDRQPYPSRSWTHVSVWEPADGSP